MKKLVSLAIVLAILASGSFSVVSLSTTVHAEEVRNVEEMNDVETMEIAPSEEEVLYVEATEPELPLAAAPEVPEVPEVSEVSNVESEEIAEEPVVSDESIPAYEEEEINSLPTLLDEYDAPIVPYVYEGCSAEIDEECIVFSLEEMYFQCKELEADVKICLVEYEEIYYLVTEWSNGGRGYTPVYGITYEDGEEFFFSFGEFFRMMILNSYVTGEQMY